MLDNPDKLVLSDWQDCGWPHAFVPIFPFYRDYRGKWQLSMFSTQTQRRIVVLNGKRKFEYREREETADEWESRQF